MVREGKTYDFHDLRIQNANDRGYVFCPEYSADVACKISYHGQPAIFLFGASETPDPPVRKTSQPIEERMNNILNSTQILPSSTKIFLPEERHEVISSDTCCPVENKSSGASSVLQVPQNATITETTSRSVEVTIRLGNDLSNDEVVKWNISIKANPHLLIVGLPGMGKTTSLINICLQMMESGICPIVFSYHNDIDEILVGKLGDNVQYVDYGGLGYNPLKVISDNPIGYIDNISMLRDIFASIFTDLGDIQLGRIREALKQSYLDKGWGDVGKDRDCLEFPEFQSFYDYLQATNKKDKVDKGVLTRLDELNDYGFFQKALSEVQCLLETSKLVIIRIHKTQNEVLQQAFASFILHNLYQQMFSRGVQQKISHAIIFDEAHRAAKLKLIPAMAKECRKFGVAFVLASQEAKDFDPSVFNAVANYLTLRVNEADAKVMAKIMASSEQVNRFTDRIKQLPKYHAFFFGEGRNRAANVQLDG